MDGLRDVLAHHSRLQGSLGARPDGKHAVVLQQYRRAMADVGDYRLADLLLADLAIRPARDRPAELVGDSRQHSRNSHPDRREAGGVVGMRVDHAVDVRHLAVDHE